MKPAPPVTRTRAMTGRRLTVGDSVACVGTRPGQVFHDPGPRTSKLLPGDGFESSIRFSQCYGGVHIALGVTSAIHSGPVARNHNSDRAQQDD